MEVAFIQRFWRRRILLPRSIPFFRFLDCGEEFIVADRLQEEVEGRDFVALEGVLFKCGGENHTRFAG